MDKDEVINDIQEIIIHAVYGVSSPASHKKAEAVYNAGYRKSGVCRWQRITHKKSGSWGWRTECGYDDYCIMKFQEMKFCPYCGNRIEVEES